MNLQLVATEGRLLNLGSPIGKDLTKLFQTYIDQVKAIDSNKAKRKFIRSKSDDIRTSLEKIYTKHLKITPEVVISYQPNMMFACAMYMQDVNLSLIESSDTMRFRKKHTYGVTMSVKKIMERYDELEKMYDPETQSFTVSQLPRYMTYQFYFDPFVAFSIHGCVEASLRNLTAREVTAIMLHELGHMLYGYENLHYWESNAHELDTIIKTSYDSCETLNQKIKFIKELHKEIKVKRKKPTTKEFDMMVKNLPDNAKDNPETKKQCDIVLSHIRDASITGLIYALIVMALTGIETLFAGGYKEKRGETLEHADTKTLAEQYADKFAVRSGYGPDLMSGLELLTQAIHANPYSAWIRGNIATRVFWLYVMLSYRIVPNMFKNLKPYEVHYVRLRSMSREILKNLRTANLSDGEKEFILQQYDKSQKQLHSLWNLLNFPDAIKWVSEVILFSIAPIPMYQLFVNGKIDKRYGRMFKALQELSIAKSRYGQTKLELAMNKK